MYTGYKLMLYNLFFNVTKTDFNTAVYGAVTYLTHKIYPYVENKWTISDVTSQQPTVCETGTFTRSQPEIMEMGQWSVGHESLLVSDP